MIHYHGGVLHTDAVQEWEYTGRNFCVSYAYPEKIELYHRIGQSVMLDNGAFSLWKNGTPTDWPGYYRWCEPWLEWQTTWAIIPDIMDGDWRDNAKLIKEWPFGDKGAPVYHMPEPLQVLEDYCEEWPLVCVSISSEHYGTINSAPWRKRMDEMMDVACDADGFPKAKLHLLRGLKFSGGPYPLYSADSASVARSWQGSPKAGIEPKALFKFFASFDGVNPPARWERPLPQDPLFADDGIEGDVEEGLPLGEPHPDTDKPGVPIQRIPSNRVQGKLL